MKKTLLVLAAVAFVFGCSTKAPKPSGTPFPINKTLEVKNAR